MFFLKANERDRFLYILGQARYEMMDGVHIPSIGERTFSRQEYDYIDGICKYIEKMVNLYDSKCALVKEEYSAEEDVKRGRWEPHPTEREWDVCSVCGIGTKRREYGLQDRREWVTEWNYPYCANCGAKMDEVDKNGDEITE